jgi:uncharacterized protein
VTEAETIEQLLTWRRWAVVGATPDPYKPSCYVPQYLQAHGFEIVPVNPDYDEVLGQRCYPDLASVPGEIDVVDLFRRAVFVGGHVDEAAAERARRAGLLVVQDRCPKIELPRLLARRSA